VKKSFVVIGLVCAIISCGVSGYALDIVSPPYENLLDGSGVDITSSVSLLNGEYPHGTMDVTVTNNNSVAIQSIQWIPNIILWGVKDNNVMYQDTLDYSMTNGNMITFSNYIGGKTMTTRLTVTGVSSLETYEVDNAFPDFWTFGWTSFTAEVNPSSPNTFYGAELGDLNPGESLTFTIETFTRVNGTAFPAFLWGPSSGEPYTTFDMDWDFAGIVQNQTAIPEPMTVLLFGLALIRLMMRKVR